MSKDQDYNAEVLPSINLNANTDSKAQDTLNTDKNIFEDLNRIDHKQFGFLTNNNEQN